jgi:hypothetical protein
VGGGGAPSRHLDVTKKLAELCIGKRVCAIPAWNGNAVFGTDTVHLSRNEWQSW